MPSKQLRRTIVLKLGLSENLTGGASLSISFGVCAKLVLIANWAIVFQIADTDATIPYCDR
jgi:hypothetical protein